jgi:hypothetical protein
MSLPETPIPGLQPGYEWHLRSIRPLRYALHEPCVTSEGIHTFQWRLSLTHSVIAPDWFVSANFNGEQWQVTLPESKDPPFQLAEVLYDAAK